MTQNSLGREGWNLRRRGDGNWIGFSDLRGLDEFLVESTKTEGEEG